MAIIVTRAGKGSALTWTEGDANITNLNNDKIESLLEDLTPQLGGDLDINGHTITSNSNGDIVLTPNGTGAVILDGNEFPQTQGENGQILVADGSGLLEWKQPERIMAYVYNADSVTINKGEPVYVFSAQGDQISVKRALNTGDATSAQTLGLANENIEATASGYVVCQGPLTNINTSTYTAGQALYLGSTAGSITTTKPYAPNHLVYLGFVEKVNGSSGRIYVKAQNGYELDELHNVNIDHNVSIANKDYLVYNSSNSLWENRQLDIVNDTTPQLGGSLDVNGQSIVSVSNGNIVLAPNGTGKVSVSSALEATGILSGLELTSSNSSGDEGGQINLAKAVTNTTLVGTGVTIDVYQNKLRFFEQGGTARGAYIDLTAASAGVGTNLLSGGGSSISTVIFSFSSPTLDTGSTYKCAVTELLDTGNIASVSSTYNFTLPAGTYLIFWQPQVYRAAGIDGSRNTGYAFTSISGDATISSLGTYEPASDTAAQDTSVWNSSKAYFTLTQTSTYKFTYTQTVTNQYPTLLTLQKVA